MRNDDQRASVLFPLQGLGRGLNSFVRSTETLFPPPLGGGCPKGRRGVKNEMLNRVQHDEYSVRSTVKNLSPYSPIALSSSKKKAATRIIRDAGGVTSDRHHTGWVRSPYRVAHTAPYRKFGFTLAEVLITLGVIGIIAALTMPNLIANYRKKVLVTQLKKTVSTLEQGFHMVLAEDGVDSLSNSSLASRYGGCCNIDKMYKIFNATELPQQGAFYELSQGAIPWATIVEFADGSCVGFGSPNDDSSFLNLTVDVNCDKKPNKLGLDTYSFNILNSGSVDFSNSEFFAFKGSTRSELSLSYIDDKLSKCSDSAPYDTYEFNDSSDYCTYFALYSIVSHGWKMVY